jgi:transcriptional regulator with PAS, ATPase and Fis domain
MTDTKPTDLALTHRGGTLRDRLAEHGYTAEHQAYGFDAIVGDSAEMAFARSMLKRIALSAPGTVLVVGDTGTGKDLAAKVLHYNSDRAGGPFVTIACSALPEPLLESELFGHERGAFTGAISTKRGLLEVAQGGTVFLDDVAELSPALQAKLLRFLDERTFKRLGGVEDIHVDARVVAATHHDLASEIHYGGFREDLFYRLQVMTIALPPLRQRLGDVPVLARYFLDRFNTQFGRHVRGITAEAMASLEQHTWPGNVRELRNLIERAVLLLDGLWLREDDLPMLIGAGSAAFGLPGHSIRLHDVERQLVVEALERAGGNQTRAGQLLGINRAQVRQRILKYGLPQPRARRQLPH